MIVDIHLHSLLSIQNGDAIQWESKHDSIKRLHSNHIEIAAFTDHNIFSCYFYKEIRQLAATADILILPGIEVNVVRTDGKLAHILYLFDEDLSETQLKQIEQIAKKEIPRAGISLEKCNTIFKDFETIMIPHVGKSEFFKYEDLKKISFDAIEISNNLDKNYLSVIKKPDIKTSVVAFSDTHRWKMYPQLSELITVIDGMKDKSFKQLKLKLLENKNYTKRRIND